MRKILSVVAAFILLANIACAQDEEPEGLIPKLMKRFKKEDAQAVAPKAPAAPAERAVPASVKEAPEAATTEAVRPQVEPVAKDVVEQAKEKAAAKASSAEASTKRTIRQMSKEELLTEIRGTLDDEEEILDYIPTLKKLKDESGKEYYAYNKGGVMKRLDELDMKELQTLLSRIYNQATLIQTQRINDQLETIRQVQNLSNQLESARRAVPQVPQVPQQPPRVPNIAPAPAAPRTPAQAPRTPQVPPAQPKR